ncbi:DUF4865 family protein [Piscinibacter gummiphilus]|uniref:DUF4865 family protein n=1 Tax=Piscinibacter gummiphilus TaxID=946333 RepID=A0ABZ0CYU1_9BURK|nr:DUF4865 family protein [Piscinibacter gummiphilus]WOB10120.1 DUF4865 family protein [Piscinibacter gummiphilus]
MRSMQYAVTLPAAFDMDLIRRRIADKGHMLDDMEGLSFKAWLYAVRAEHGPENRYAPFYLWHDEAAMRSFLLGPSFSAFMADFGRPPVRSWMTLHAALTPLLREARVATMQSVVVPVGSAPAVLLSTEISRADGERARGALAAVVALDPNTWSLVRLQLWRAIPATAIEGEAYAVGHVSVGVPPSR